MSILDRGLERRLQREAQVGQLAAERERARHAHAVRRRDAVVARARRALPVHGTVAASSLGLIAATDAPTGLLAGIAVLFAAQAASAVQVLRKPPPVPALPVQHAAPPPPPPRGSAAWPVLRRLEGVRTQLTRLVPLVAPAGREVAEEAWAAAGEADLALRWQAARFAAVEPLRGADPELLRAMEDGVRAQEQLLQGVADLVAASSDPLGSRRLQEATDALHGLADGLRALR